MNTKESFKNDIIKVKTVSKIEKPINILDLETPTD